MSKSLGQFIRMHRLRQDLTQERLAEMARVSRWQLAQMERGKNVSVDFLIKVVRALGLTEVRIDFLTLLDVTPDTPALMAAAEALDIADHALAQAHEVSKEIARAKQVINALLARPAVPADAQRHIAAAAERLASAPADRTAEIGRALRESAESSGRPAPVSRPGSTPAARRRAR